MIALSRQALARILLALMLTVAAITAQAANDLLKPNTFSANPNPLGAFSSDDPIDFLDVTEAFPFQALLNDQTLTLHWDIEPGYYLYQERFRLVSEAAGPSLTPEYPPGVDKYDEYFEKNMTMYYSGVTLRLALPEDTAPFLLRVESQGCAEAGLCYPPHSEYLRIDPASGTIATLTEESFFAATPAPTPSAPLWLPRVLLFALLGGIILNLMPCVFPVLSIKVLSLVEADRARLKLHGLAYTLGILACFVGFALVLLAARQGGEAIGWGFQLQSPLMISALVYLFLLMGLSLTGIINLGNRLMGAGQSLTQKRGLSGSFFTGVLAAVVASPCTAPFMGVALGYALTQPALVAVAVFAALGLGMALPLLLLCYAPKLMRYLPHPGPWMDTLKQLLAFPLYLTAIWLLWVLGRQVGSDGIIALLGGALAFAFSLWVWSLPNHGQPGKLLRSIVALAALVLALIAPFKTVAPAATDDRWQGYSAGQLDTLRSEGRGVFVNLTADWCLTCLANERITLNTDTIHEAFDRHNIATLKGDWTNRDPAITRLLEEYGRSGVPLYLWFAPGSQGPAVVLPQLLRKEHLLRALGEKNDNN